MIDSSNQQSLRGGTRLHAGRTQKDQVFQTIGLEAMNHYVLRPIHAVAISTVLTCLLLA